MASCSEVAQMRNILQRFSVFSLFLSPLWLLLSLSSVLLCPLTAHSSSGWRHRCSWNRPPAATCRCEAAKKMHADVSHRSHCNYRQLIFQVQHITELKSAIHNDMRASELCWCWAKQWRDKQAPEFTQQACLYSDAYVSGQSLSPVGFHDSSQMLQRQLFWCKLKSSVICSNLRNSAVTFVIGLPENCSEYLLSHMC